MKWRLLISLVVFWEFGCQNDKPVVNTDDFFLSFDDSLKTFIQPKSKQVNSLFNSYQNSEYLVIDGKKTDTFRMQQFHHNLFSEKTGDGRALNLTASHKTGDVNIQKVVSVKVYDDFPDLAVFNVAYINLGSETITINKWVNHDYFLNGNQDSIPFWSFQSGTYESRPDWVLPLKNGFKQKNYMGMNASDYGGGTPVSDVWRKDAGIAVGHLETSPKLIALPVESENVQQGARMAVEYEKMIQLQPGDTLKTFTTFVTLHRGDYFESLNRYRRFMAKLGLVMPEFSDTAYEPVWCAWGYERGFTTAQVLNTLPKVKEMGYEWAVLDDGWQTAEGDWFLNPEKFPNGAKDMQKFTKAISDQGLKSKIWWAPLAVDPGTELLKNHPDLLLLDKNGEKQLISWWDSYYLCPAYDGTIEYTKNLIKTMMQDWGFAGLKIDGQHLNGVAPCYNPSHHHAYPEESVEKLQDFWKMVYETATSINPDAVVEICPCGTASTFFNMPYMNQPVASDPTSSWQIRLKGKTYKALMGPSVPYYGDHVELSDSSSDFASSVGIGAVIGTKFTWPVGVHINTESGDVSLTESREKKWKKWLDIYLKYQLPKGHYLGNLYDIGFDKPETHVVKKGDAYFYAFYEKEFAGRLEIRGLENGKYNVTDYVAGKDLGQVSSDDPFLETEFSDYLLIRVSPIP
ncbi:MAG: alpha-galactosidase [Calditrichaeota bacterium]|nr:alpha-galactosidase [Calditrichota bacterium]